MFSEAFPAGNEAFMLRVNFNISVNFDSCSAFELSVLKKSCNTKITKYFTRKAKVIDLFTPILVFQTGPLPKVLSLSKILDDDRIMDIITTSEVQARSVRRKSKVVNTAACKIS